MRRRTVVIIVSLCLGAISVGLFLTYRIWGYGIFPGRVVVHAQTQDPTPEGSPIMNSITVNILEDRKLLGQSDKEIQVTSGEHTFSFGAYSSEYETPSDERLIVKPFETTDLSVNYLARFAYLVVDTSLYDEYYRNSSSIGAQIFVDGEYKGSGHISLKLNSSYVGNCVVSFGNITGFKSPSNQSASIAMGSTAKVTGTYNRILTPEQEVYVFARRKVESPPRITNATSMVDLDQFKQWIRDDRITSPRCYISKPRPPSGENWQGDALVKYDVARYAGINKEDKIKAAEDIFYHLNSSGVDLRLTGDMWTEHYNDDAECIVVAELEYGLDYVTVDIAICKFNESDIDALPDLSTTTNLAGIGFAFSGTKQVYVKTDSTTIPFGEAYVPPFLEYSPLKENTKGWWWTEWKHPYSYSGDPRALFRSLRIEKS